MPTRQEILDRLDSLSGVTSTAVEEEKNNLSREQLIQEMGPGG